MAKRGKVLAFRSWLNLAMQDVSLLMRLVVSVIPQNKLRSLERVHEPTGEWAKQS